MANKTTVEDPVPDNSIVIRQTFNKKYGSCLWWFKFFFMCVPKPPEWTYEESTPEILNIDLQNGMIQPTLKSDFELVSNKAAEYIINQPSKRNLSGIMLLLCIIISVVAYFLFDIVWLGVPIAIVYMGVYTYCGMKHENKIRTQCKVEIKQYIKNQINPKYTPYGIMWTPHCRTLIIGEGNNTTTFEYLDICVGPLTQPEPQPENDMIVVTKIEEQESAPSFQPGEAVNN